MLENFITCDFVIPTITVFPGPFLAELATASTFREAWGQSNWIDMVVILGLLSGVFTGVGVGFYRSSALLLGSTIGLVLAGQFSVPLAMTPLFSSIRADLGPLASQVLAGFIIFSSCASLAFLTTVILRSFFDQTLRICDNVLGGLMGISLAGVLLGVLFLGVFQWPDSRLHQPIHTSLSGPAIAEYTRQLGRFFPQPFRERFDLSSAPSRSLARPLAGVLATSGDPPPPDPHD
ncbi:MAG: CvpA family protein [Planctomycetota bacterium]|nr:CvpA family protein [Planctomycetota bacterium]